MSSGSRRYADKHLDATVDATVAGRLGEQCPDRRLTCQQACELALELEVPLELVGETADLLEMKIVQCRLGLFGREDEGRADGGAPSPVVARLIDERLEGGALPCAVAWQVAERAGVDPEVVGAACDALGIKVVACQLGAF